ncbi:unnamed protein product [Arabidopsis lyrata]|uniref:Uncharacterized protein n=1 Tax=Arabidopsis lyrata subsp. lyrata TaxID=81972 RepID=D7MI59_ARALL|nr:hypothetical protein ARALYDRAFT_915807 [Arabidopsis lyrata subsp. lyrata]CAH8277214.1 unnamed protein product [Arabidopsis lyrata]
MLLHIDYFLAFPWGRKSFIDTFSRFGPPLISSATETLTSRLLQNKCACYKGPLPLQLLAFQTTFLYFCTRPPHLMTQLPFLQIQKYANLC